MTGPARYRIVPQSRYPNTATYIPGLDLAISIMDINVSGSIANEMLAIIPKVDRSKTNIAIVDAIMIFLG